MSVTTPEIMNKWLNELSHTWELVRDSNNLKKNYIWEYVKNRNVFLTIPKNSTPVEYNIFERLNAKIILAVKNKETSEQNIDKLLEDIANKYDKLMLRFEGQEKIKYLENKINKLSRDIGMSEYVIEETRDYIEKMTDHIAQMTDHIEEKKDCLQKTKQSLEKEIKKLKKAK